MYAIYYLQNRAEYNSLSLLFMNEICTLILIQSHLRQCAQRTYNKTTKRYYIVEKFNYDLIVSFCLQIIS